MPGIWLRSQCEKGTDEEPVLRKHAQSSRPPTVVAEGSWHILQFYSLNFRTAGQILLPRNSPECEEEMMHAPTRCTAAFKEMDLMFHPKMANGASNKQESQ